MFYNLKIKPLPLFTLHILLTSACSSFVTKYPVELRLDHALVSNQKIRDTLASYMHGK